MRLSTGRQPMQILALPRALFPYHFRDNSQIEAEYIYQARRVGSLFAEKIYSGIPIRAINFYCF